MKQVIVMRTDLNMRKGKMIAQGAHATLGCFLGRSITPEQLIGTEPYAELHPDIMKWIINDGMKKICVRADSEEQLMDIYKRAMGLGLRAYLVCDAGHTEFKEPTITCIAIGPDEDERIDEVTGELKLL